MKLVIKTIKIENFKGFESLEFEPNDNFNIIIGENNIGKSSVFEAIQLWKRCYDLSIKSDDKGFYKSSPQSNLYLPFSDLYFLRVTHDRELFNTASHTCVLTMTLLDNETGSEFSLGFEIVKPSSISNAYYKVRASRGSDFSGFSDYLARERVRLSKAIFIYQTRPVANILAYEPLMNVGQISKKIEKGKSQEVLRNKIVIGRSATQIEELQKKITDVVDYEFSFDFVNRTRKEFDEYVDLKVKTNGKSLDLHLQGSGFLQVAEIFSTITYVDAPLSILLVDEPDSHIHTTLQKALIEKLKSIETSQIFVISHNDNFVGEAREGELYYLNTSAKNDGVLKYVEINKFDMIKKELGGTILALEKMNHCQRIGFVEGDDDIKYISSLVGIYNAYNDDKIIEKHVTFFYQRGKDNLKRKLESVNRVFSQVVGRKPYVVIYDKDFSTVSENSNFSQSIIGVTPRNSRCFSHNGYCVESVLFEDIKILSKIISLKTGMSSVQIFKFIRDFEEENLSSLRDVTSDLYREMSQSFDGQNTESRPELSNISFVDFVQDCIVGGKLKTHYIMNKNQIKKFVIKFNECFDYDLLQISVDEKSDCYSSGLFELYISQVRKSSHIYPSYVSMLHELYK
ncbi:ATP-dependent endonuclease [Vibrio sp. 10N.261.52.C2]|uniref:ATP-dependent nuclease n=1 Tax=Vibrio sp. 10N.261.52.C2 TaxID=3229681 RepID=UPI0035544206